MGQRRKTGLVAFVSAGLMVGLWQGSATAQPRQEPSIGQPGRYQIVQGAEQRPPLLLDTATGRVWVFEMQTITGALGATSRPAWTPVPFNPRENFPLEYQALSPVPAPSGR